MTSGPELLGGRRYRITHHTTYSYDDEVTDSYGLVFSRPREMPTQHVREHELWTDPGHADLGEHVDSEGNLATYFHVTEPHRRLGVSAVSVVDLAAEPVPEGADQLLWEDARPSARRDLPEASLAMEYAVASPFVELVDDASRYVGESFAPGRPLVEAVVDVVGRMHREFEYRPGSTTVTTRVREVLRAQRGVCQDFAHVLIAGLRAQGLAARYVSGYLETDPPPGKERLVGSDATHAWVHVWMPGLGWLSVDPTNDCITGDRHVTVAWGRDYADVPPVKGVIFTEAQTSSMSVAVDVAPVG